VIAGIGIDLVEIDRVARLLERHGRRGLTRLFTSREVEYCERHTRVASRYAARIAAKEAAYKALARAPGAASIGWTEIEVTMLGTGAPDLIWHGRAALAVAALGVQQVWLTLTHTDTAAAAVVVLESH